MRVEKILLDKNNREIGMLQNDSDETRVSFYFNNGDNFHFQLKKSASKAELRNVLLGVAELINKSN